MYVNFLIAASSRVEAGSKNKVGLCAAERFYKLGPFRCCKRSYDGAKYEWVLVQSSVVC